MNKEYFRIVFAQMKLNLDYDSEKEFLVDNELYFDQMEKIIEYVKKVDFDVLVFPELTYHNKYDKFFLDISLNKIIVFGSVYINNENFTIVYNNNKKTAVKKVFSCGVEPSIRYQQDISVKEFFKTELSNHTFKIKGKKFIVLNCAEYYKVAYLIARDEVKNKNLFGFLVPCANNNAEVFLSESIALHNHNENVYSFVVNSVADYKNEFYSVGKSYVFGKISSFEKMCDCNNRMKSSSNICLLDDGCYVVDGMYLYKNGSSYYRSDDYRHTPKNMIVKKIGEI